MKLINHLKHNIKIFLKERKNIESINHQKSYSQSGEDLIIKFLFDSLSITKPSYIDIGAHDPYLISNTALFYDLGSRGINIDPDINLLDKFKTIRNEDKNLNLGVGSEKSKMKLYIMSERSLNTLSQEEAQQYVKEGIEIIKTKMVDVITINEVLSKYNNDVFPDLLTLDAEGLDLEILKTINFEKSFPKVICVETISFSAERKGVKNREIIEFLENNDYLLYADTYINSIFVKKEIWK
jgi:FkbM family methyltransferase